MTAKLPQHVHRSNDAMSERLKKKFPTYVPRIRAPNEVPSMAINVWALPVYRPAAQTSVRPGADDHLHIKSRGV